MNVVLTVPPSTFLGSTFHCCCCCYCCCCCFSITIWFRKKCISEKKAELTRNLDNFHFTQIWANPCNVFREKGRRGRGGGIRMPLYQTRTIAGILEPVAQQVSLLTLAIFFIFIFIFILFYFVTLSHTNKSKQRKKNIDILLISIFMRFLSMCDTI